MLQKDLQKLFKELFFSVCHSLSAMIAHYIMNCLENISILHVLLLIYLRLSIIRSPMKRTGPLKLRKLLLLMTWMIPIILQFPKLFLWKYPYSYFIYFKIQFHILSSLSLLLILILYSAMVVVIRSKKLKNQKMLNSTENIEENGIERKTTLVISGLVFVVVVCYLPFVILRIMDVYRYSNWTVDEHSQYPCLEISNPGTLVIINYDFSNDLNQSYKKICVIYLKANLTFIFFIG